MMNAVNDPNVETITIMSAARIGKTEGVIENIMGYFIHWQPATMMMIQPTYRLAEKWSKIYFKPMVRDTQVLRELMGETNMKQTGSEILYKHFPDGYIVIGGANSATSLSMYTVRVVCFDEVDQYPPSAGSEGDPVNLGKVRAATFWNRKYVMTSTPTISEISRIETSFLSSNRQFFKVPCPHCKHLQILLFSPRSQFGNLAKGYLKFDKENLSWIHYECENCKQPIEEKSKMQMIRDGEWIPQNPLMTTHAGFQISALYSPWATWTEIAKDWLEARQAQSQELLKVFINKRLGECWEETKSIKLSEHQFLDRLEEYDHLHIPDAVILLTIGVDVQQDRLECVVKGWGLENESWFIQRRVIYGSPDIAETWKQLNDYLDSDFIKASGQRMHISSGCIDSGAFSELVYAYVKTKKRRPIFATKGKDGFNRDIIASKPKRNDRGALFFLIGVDKGKELIYDRLLITKPKMKEGEQEGTIPRYLHFNKDCDNDYFEQLTSEKIVIKKKRGYPTRVWELLRGRENHMLDCEVMNLAAITVINPNMKKLKERMAHVTPGEPVKQTEQPAPVTGATENREERKQQLVRKISSYRWRRR